MGLQGQITPSTERGTLIKKVITEYKPKSIVEIGTCGGMGSTLCILESIDYDCNFISFETNKNFYEEAKINLENYQNKVQLIHGTIVDIEDVLSFLSDKILNSEQQSWLKGDLDCMKNCELVFDKIPQKIDFLLLDGGEFSTYSEWEKLKSKTTIVALDDITVLKTNKIYSELISNKEYKLINQSSEGNGFAIFEKL
jgi:hypothetical protein